jgi:hypothetical protein
MLLPDEDYQISALEPKVRVGDPNLLAAADDVGIGARSYPKTIDLLMINPFAKPKKGKKGGKKKKK